MDRQLLGLLVVLLGLVAVGSTVSLFSERTTHQRALDNRYAEGIEAGLGAAGAFKQHEAAQPMPAPEPWLPGDVVSTADGRVMRRGPLNLDALRAYGATGRVKCFTEEGPADRRVELPSRAK